MDFKHSFWAAFSLRPPPMDPQRVPSSRTIIFAPALRWVPFFVVSTTVANAYFCPFCAAFKALISKSWSIVTVKDHCRDLFVDIRFYDNLFFDRFIVVACGLDVFNGLLHIKTP